LVLVVDDSREIGELVRDILEEEGLTVAILTRAPSAAIRAAVQRLEPDCVLLDGATSLAYGQSWLDAAWLHARARSVPVIMFSADVRATDEGRLGESARSQGAGFATVLSKPFECYDLVAAVGAALHRA
jgi:DNA-binding response OmpR family regulator